MFRSKTQCHPETCGTPAPGAVCEAARSPAERGSLYFPGEAPDRRPGLKGVCSSRWAAWRSDGQPLGVFRWAAARGDSVVSPAATPVSLAAARHAGAGRGRAAAIPPRSFPAAPGRSDAVRPHACSARFLQTNTTLRVINKVTEHFFN